MGMSSVPLLQYIFSPANIPSSVVEEAPSSKSGRSTLGSPTICTQFRAQLASLITKIHSTKPHYIRCLKPNDQNKPDLLNRVRTTEQLRYGGVLEAVRVARSGFPVRLSHEDFYSRYRPLANPFRIESAKLTRYLPTGCSRADAVKQCTALVELMWDDSCPKLAGSEKNYGKIIRRISKAEYWRGKGPNVDHNSIQLGKTKVFFRKQAHDFFEGRRSRNLVVAARSMQAGIRGWLSRIWYRKAKTSIRALQIIIRYFLFHRRFVKKRKLNAAIKMQTSYRCHLHFRRYVELQSALLSIQKCFRGLLARRVVEAILRAKYATKLQAGLRMMCERYRYRCYVVAIIALQMKVRVLIAKRKTRELKAAARDIGRLKQSNEEMKLEIERLRASAAQETARQKLHQRDEEDIKLKSTMAKATDSIAELTKQLEEERAAKREVMVKLENAEAALEGEIKARITLESDSKDTDMRFRTAEERCLLLEAELTEAKKSKAVSAVLLGTGINSSEPSDGPKEITSGYIAMSEHERIIKALHEESALLRRSISSSSEAQQYLLKEFQRRKSPLEEELTAVSNKGLQKHQSLKTIGSSGVIRRSKSDEITTSAGITRLTITVPTTIIEDEITSPIKTSLSTPRGDKSSIESRRPALVKQSKSSLSAIKTDDLHSPLSSPVKPFIEKIDPAHAELLRQVSSRAPGTPGHSRPRSMNASHLMKSLRTPEGIALLQNEYGKNNVTLDPTNPTAPVDGDISTDLGFRPSPHPDHFVAKKPMAATDAVTTTPSKDVQARWARKTFDENLENYKVKLVEVCAYVTRI
jgi:myosin heavy subunit